MTVRKPGLKNWTEQQSVMKSRKVVGKKKHMVLSEAMRSMCMPLLQSNAFCREQIYVVEVSHIFCRLPCGHMTDFLPPRFITNSFPAVFERPQWGPWATRSLHCSQQSNLKQQLKIQPLRKESWKTAFQTVNWGAQVKIRVLSQRNVSLKDCCRHAASRQRHDLRSLLSINPTAPLCAPHGHLSLTCDQ